MAADLWPDGIEAFHQPVGQMVGIIFHFILLFATFKHHHRRPGNDERKNHLHVGPQAQQAGADCHEDPTEHDRP